MLRQRIITALVMVAGFLAAIVFVSLPGLAVIFGIIVTVGGWEWARMAGWQSNISRGVYASVLAIIWVAFTFTATLVVPLWIARFNPFWVWPVCGGLWQCFG